MQISMMFHAATLPPFTPLFQRRLPHGLCVAVALPPLIGNDEAPPELERALSRLTPEELDLARPFKMRRLVPFVGGRIAMASALEAVDAIPEHLSQRPSILATPRGAPKLPPGLRGSISHKADLAVALVDADPANTDWQVGVDVENVVLPRTDISRTILTARELALYQSVAESARAWELMARFSLKEALYKALDPYVSRFVGFQEVEVDLHADGAATAHLFLPESENARLQAELWWTRLEGVVLSTARVRRR